MSNVVVFSFPDSINSDVVSYSIISASDGETFGSGSADFISDENWKIPFAPSFSDVFIIKCENQTLGITKKAIYEVSITKELLK